MVQQALKFFSHTKWLSQVLDFFYIAPPLPNLRMSRSQESQNDIAFERGTLQSGATSCTGQPHWRLQTHRGMNSNRLCVRWWQREASEKTASPRSFHLYDISKSPTSQKFSCAEITGEERTVSETAQYEATKLSSIRIWMAALPAYNLRVSHQFIESKPCVPLGYKEQILPICHDFSFLSSTFVQWHIILWLWTAGVWVITADHTTGLEHLAMLTGWQSLSGCKSQYQPIVFRAVNAENEWIDVKHKVTINKQGFDRLTWHRSKWMQCSRSLKGLWCRCTIRLVLAAVLVNYQIDRLWSYTWCFCSHLWKTRGKTVRIRIYMDPSEQDPELIGHF